MFVYRLATPSTGTNRVQDTSHPVLSVVVPRALRLLRHCARLRERRVPDQSLPGGRRPRRWHPYNKRIQQPNEITLSPSASAEYQIKASRVGDALDTGSPYNKMHPTTQRIQQQNASNPNTLQTIAPPAPTTAQGCAGPTPKLASPANKHFRASTVLRLLLRGRRVPNQQKHTLQTTKHANPNLSLCRVSFCSAKLTRWRCFARPSPSTPRCQR